MQTIANSSTCVTLTSDMVRAVCEKIQSTANSWACITPTADTARGRRPQRCNTRLEFNAPHDATELTYLKWFTNAGVKVLLKCRKTDKQVKFYCLLWESTDYESPLLYNHTSNVCNNFSDELEELSYELQQKAAESAKEVTADLLEHLPWSSSNGTEKFAVAARVQPELRRLLGKADQHDGGMLFSSRVFYQDERVTEGWAPTLDTQKPEGLLHKGELKGQKRDGSNDFIADPGSLGASGRPARQGVFSTFLQLGSVEIEGFNSVRRHDNRSLLQFGGGYLKGGAITGSNRVFIIITKELLRCRRLLGRLTPQGICGRLEKNLHYYLGVLHAGRALVGLRGILSTFSGLIETEDKVFGSEREFVGAVKLQFASTCLGRDVRNDFSESSDVMGEEFSNARIAGMLLHQAECDRREEVGSELWASSKGLRHRKVLWTSFKMNGLKVGRCSSEREFGCMMSWQYGNMNLQEDAVGTVGRLCSNYALIQFECTRIADERTQWRGGQQESSSLDHVGTWSANMVKMEAETLGSEGQIGRRHLTTLGGVTLDAYLEQGVVDASKKGQWELSMKGSAEERPLLKTIARGCILRNMENETRHRAGLRQPLEGQSGMITQTGHFMKSTGEYDTRKSRK